LAVQFGHRFLATIALAVVVLGVIAALSAYGVLSNSKSLQSYGSVKAVNVGVYWDNGCTNITSTVDWGMLSPGTSKNVTLYVRNEGNTAVKLSLTTQNWNPLSASNYMRLSWSREAQTVNLGSVLNATLTFSVFSNVTGITNFSFDIVIAGTEQ